MTTSYFVIYEGSAADPGGFLERYREVHVPLLAAWPGIRSVTLHQPEPWTDTHPVRPANLALMCQMEFDTPGALAKALASPARDAARADFRAFPAFNGRVLHQAMSSLRLSGG